MRCCALSATASCARLDAAHSLDLRGSVGDETTRRSSDSYATVPSSHTCALDFFFAGETCDPIAQEGSRFGAEAWAARTKGLGSRRWDRQIARKRRGT